MFPKAEISLKSVVLGWYREYTLIKHVGHFLFLKNIHKLQN